MALYWVQACLDYIGIFMNTATLLVKCLEAQGVSYIFGVPGAKIDSVFDALVDSSIQLILCRHEQNAAFMAAAYGRLTGKPGVIVVTSGPGVTNLTTGLLTATTEGDPIVAIGGNVPRAMSLKASHQNAENTEIMKPVTKLSVEVRDSRVVSEAVVNAFKVACMPRKGACFLSFPQDVLIETVENTQIILPEDSAISLAPETAIEKAASIIQQAKLPVLLLGEEASVPSHTQVIRELLAKVQLPTVSTFQAAGVVSKALLPCFAGRVGLFANTIGDQLLQAADVVVTIGLDRVEYDPETWNADQHLRIVHIDDMHAAIGVNYQPEVEVVGDIAQSVSALSKILPENLGAPHLSGYPAQFKQALATELAQIKPQSDRIHPLAFIQALSKVVDQNTSIACDVGSLYMWMARYFLSYEPHQLLFSNGQQTLGVGLPWAMAAKLAYPEKDVISISGDGGFLFSAMELETAVREQLHIIHFIWSDGTYNMVLEQQLMKYHRGSGVELGQLNIVDFAKGFGATGLTLNTIDQFDEVLAEARQVTGPVLIDVAIDYQDNHRLFEALHEHIGN